MQIPPALSRVLPDEITFTPPVIGLIATNIITIILAVLQNWDAAIILFTFWMQSLITGLSSAAKLLSADTILLAAEPGIAEECPGGGPVASTGRVWTYKILVAGFFLFHDGLFHLKTYMDVQMHIVLHEREAHPDPSRGFVWF